MNVEKVEQVHLLIVLFIVDVQVPYTCGELKGNV